MEEVDLVEQITRRLGVAVDEIQSYFVEWEGEQFPLIQFAQVNKKTPEVLDSLLSNPIGTPICLIVDGVPSSPFLLLRRKIKTPRNALISDYYYTIEAYYVGGSFLGLVEHVKGMDVLKAKRSLAASADEGERLRYTVLAEGAQPRVVSVYHGKRRVLY